jgi:SET domain-containing protein
VLLVKTRIRPSKIEGTGLFADEFIKKGTIVWQWEEDFDLRIHEKELEKLSAPAKEQFLKYCYFSKRSNRFVLCFDDARFINHSDTPNLKNVFAPEAGEDFDIALHDIHPGEEITGDYKEGDPRCLNLPNLLLGLKG